MGLKMVREREEEQAWRQERIGELAGEVMKLARDSIVVNMRFLDTALSRLEAEARNGLGGAAADGGKLYYDPAWLLKKYREETGYPVRLYLHVLFHFVFYHSYHYREKEGEPWDLAVDAAVENVILEMALPMGELDSDGEARRSEEHTSELQSQR